jgi:hypothetical protein
MIPKIGIDFRDHAQIKVPQRPLRVQMDARRCSDRQSLSRDGVCRFNARQNRAFA